MSSKWNVVAGAVIDIRPYLIPNRSKVAAEAKNPAQAPPVMALTPTSEAPGVRGLAIALSAKSS